MRGLTRLASLEFGPRGIRVNVVHPGYVETEMSSDVAEWWKPQHAIAAPHGRGASPEEIAPAIVFLISDESSSSPAPSWLSTAASPATRARA